MKNIICPQCKLEVPEVAIVCPFCKFGILVYLEEKREREKEKEEK